MKQDIIVLIEQIAEQLVSVYQQQEEQHQAAWWLLEKLLHTNKAMLLAKNEIVLTDEQKKQINAWIYEHVVLNKPLQYILGSVPFCNLEILVEPPTLIPRPETEQWCHELMQQLQPFKNEQLSILDLCTGSGCIALALASVLPKAEIVATDISLEALKLAHKNARYNAINNVTFMHSDLYNALPAQSRFDIIVANPPYIAQSEWQTLAASVKQWEDSAALIADNQGLDVIERIIKEAPVFIRPNTIIRLHNIAQLILEIDHTQADSVQACMVNNGFYTVSIKKDIAGKDRVAMGVMHA